MEEHKFIIWAMGSVMTVLIFITWLALRYAVHVQENQKHIDEDPEYQSYKNQRSDLELQLNYWNDAFTQMEQATIEEFKNPELKPNPIDSQIVQLTVKYTLTLNE